MNNLPAIISIVYHRRVDIFRQCLVHIEFAQRKLISYVLYFVID